MTADMIFFHHETSLMNDFDFHPPVQFSDLRYGAALAFTLCHGNLEAVSSQVNRDGLRLIRDRRSL